ncbi:MAG: hypothetical protein HYT07_03650 [Candidatus Levybacteria bacterium]|nr:hypothetical protein [Candidatus Levybacteria bacterium]
MIIAHRGYSKLYQENTIRAFDAAIKAGAEGIECDLRLTSDNKVVVNHNNKLRLNGVSVKISDTKFSDLLEMRKHAAEELLTLDELFEYIPQKQAEFFLEVKSSSPLLIDAIIKKTREKKLWSQIHVVGFSFILKNSLSAQSYYPKLRVDQFLRFPRYSFIKRPPKSYGIFLGWLDSIPGSQTFFRALVARGRLLKLKARFEKNGFNVMAGVINNDAGLRLFNQAGIKDIVTDRISETINYFKLNGHKKRD